MVPRVLGTPGLWPSHSCSGVRALGGRLAEAADSRSPPLLHGNWGAIWKAPLYSKGPPASTPSPARLSEPPTQAAFAGWGGLCWPEPRPFLHPPLAHATEPLMQAVAASSLAPRPVAVGPHPYSLWPGQPSLDHSSVDLPHLFVRSPGPGLVASLSTLREPCSGSAPEPTHRHDPQVSRAD